MVESLDHRTTLCLRLLSDVKLFYEVYMPTSRERERESSAFYAALQTATMANLWQLLSDFCITIMCIDSLVTIA